MASAHERIRVADLAFLIYHFHLGGNEVGKVLMLRLGNRGLISHHSRQLQMPMLVDFNLVHVALHLIHELLGS